MSNHEFSLASFIAAPRVADLVVSPDGTRLVVGVATPDPDGHRYRTALWELDPTASRQPRQLTRSAKGEASPRFLPDGTLLFMSPRPDPDASSDDDDDETPALWALPASSGEARLLAAPPGGVTGVTTAERDTRVALTTAMHPGAQDWEQDREQEQARKDRKVTAQLFESYPVRFWDRWLGPRKAALFGGDAAAATPQWVATALAEDGRLELTAPALSPDGARLVTTRWVNTPDPRDRVSELVVFDLAAEGSAEAERVLTSEARIRFSSPTVSPDGSKVAAVRAPHGTPEQAPDHTLVVIDLATGQARDMLTGFDRWPQAPVWSPDGDAVLFTADDDGRTLPFRVAVSDGSITRLAAEGAFNSLRPSPDGTTVYALHSDVDVPPRAVALSAHAADQQPRAIPTPGDDLDPPGRVERVETTADDGVRVPGWLVLPPDHRSDQDPPPLVVFIHGGPLSTWAGWHWRWSPHVLAAQGWAVLLPDPALSTGYGWDFVQRGWGRWGDRPYTDLMALVDAVVARPDVDEGRTAAMGGSFGGYMANWVAGHTDRFDAIVTHASLWNLEAFHGVTDLGPWWENEFGDRYLQPERYREWSPHRFVDQITTPMLVIHGERDFRVPVGEGIALWTDLARHGVEASYLHLPDENHWVLTPGHAKVWYEAVLAFLDHHVRGAPGQRPELL